MQPTDTIRQPTHKNSGEKTHFDKCKIQHKAYRVSSESQNHYQEKERAKKSLVNFTSQPFNIISYRDEGQFLDFRRPNTTIAAGKCHKNYGISDFTHISRKTAPNFNQEFQKAYSSNNGLFKRKNGQFSEWFNCINTQKFISVPFQKSPAHIFPLAPTPYK